MTVEDLQSLLGAEEDEHCEFKAARNSYNKDKVVEYCIALANEGGGKLVLGVTNSKPRQVAGTRAFTDFNEVKRFTLQRASLRIDAEVIDHPSGRVVVFGIPSQPMGTPLHLDGRYLMRSGESLVPMPADMLQRIFAETSPDFSSEKCGAASTDDLEPEAIEEFRRRWLTKAGNTALLHMPTAQILEDSELTVDGKVTYAALILLGRNRSLGRFLPNAEVVYEYRGAPGQITASQRSEFREGFLSFHDRLWNQINARNEVHSIREGLFRQEIPAFNEDAVREAVLNAICHRDYRLGGSVFVSQFPTHLRVASPGGFLPGITVDNVLDKQAPRNRRLAEACAKCGLVERSGQGMDRIFHALLREGKGQPDFAGTDSHEVVLTLRGEVVDRRFIKLLDDAERQNFDISVRHLVVLDLIRQHRQLPEAAGGVAAELVRFGLAEKAGRGKQSRLILSRGMYGYLGEAGAYTRHRGLDRETNKQLVLKHIRDSRGRGASLAEFRQVLPLLTERQVRHLVGELRRERHIERLGWAKSARWFLTGSKEAAR